MDLYAAIFSLKSTRKFEMQALDAALLDELEAVIGGIVPLCADAGLYHRLTDKTKGMFGVTAPHYLIIGGDGKTGQLEAAGFAYQQANLWLSSQGIGTIWLAGARDSRAERESDFVALAFGRAQGSPHRSLAEFNRKPMADVTNALDDDCVQAARLAPSGMNAQPWYFELEGDRAYVYAKPPSGLMAMGYKLTDLDIGIALGNLAVAAAHFGRPFGFERTGGLPAKDGWASFGVVSWS
jgi:nitroreductase